MNGPVPLAIVHRAIALGASVALLVLPGCGSDRSAAPAPSDLAAATAVSLVEDGPGAARAARDPDDPAVRRIASLVDPELFETFDTELLDGLERLEGIESIETVGTTVLETDGVVAVDLDVREAGHALAVVRVHVRADETGGWKVVWIGAPAFSWPPYDGVRPSVSTSTGPDGRPVDPP